MDATPAVTLPPDADLGLPDAPAAMTIRERTFTWGSRTYVMGILNVTPDSFSGDGLLSGTPGDADGRTGGAAGESPVERAVALARRMVEEGADILDVGGESSRPGHTEVSEQEELARVIPVVAAVRAALPGIPLSIDTVKPRVAAAALDAGADLVNDVWGTGDDAGLERLAAERGAPLVLMHNRAEPRYRNLLPEIIADLERSIERAVAAGVSWDRLIVDPGIGFGKTAEHNLELLGALDLLHVLARPILLGTSRKSTIGKVLDLPAAERLEGTLATTALAVRAGVDIVRVHDVAANVRAARMSDAIVRRREPPRG